MNTTIAATHLASTTGSNEPKSDHDHPHPDATTTAHHRRERALVLGGGGSAGNAWLIGVVAGLCDAALDVTEPDLIIGTSAGATAAAQIAHASPLRLFADILSASPPQQRTGAVGSHGGRAATGPVADQMRRTSAIIAASADPADMRR